MKNKFIIYVCIIVSILIVATASVCASANIDFSSNEKLIGEYIDAVHQNVENTDVNNAINNAGSVFNYLKENNDDFKNLNDEELTNFFNSGTIENMDQYDIFNEENLKTIYKITTGKDLRINYEEKTNQGTFAYKICIAVLAFLFGLSVVVIIKINKQRLNQRKKQKKESRKSNERDQYISDSLYKLECEKKDDELKRASDELKQKNVEINKLKESVYEYKQKLQLIQKENDELETHNNSVFTQKEIDEINQKTMKVKKQKKKFTNTIDMYNEYINTNEEIELKTVGVRVNDGYIDIYNGDIVYAEKIGENKICIYPKNNIISDIFRDSLAIYFQYNVHGNRTIKLKKPCVLMNTSYGYKIVEKGVVVIS